MHTTNLRKFKGEIENYVNNRNNIFESRIDRVFSFLNFRTNLCRTNIKKKDGYHPAHLLFILTLLPMLKIDTVHRFCLKQWHNWSTSKKDTFYRFKQANYRWRTFMYKVIEKISDALHFQQSPLRY